VNLHPGTRLASDLGRTRQKYHRTVQKYVCTVQYLDGLRHLPPRMKNQHGLNEEKNHIGKKIISQLSACEVLHVISLDTNNQA